MARTVLLLSALLLALGGLAGFNALELPPEVLIVPGAVNVRVIEASWGRRVISYRVTELPSVWMRLVGRRLEARGWLRVHRDNPYMGTHTYRHVAVAGPFYLIRNVVLQDAHREARVSSQMQLVLVWWRLGLDPRASAHAQER